MVSNKNMQHEVLHDKGCNALLAAIEAAPAETVEQACLRVSQAVREQTKDSAWCDYSVSASKYGDPKPQASFEVRGFNRADLIHSSGANADEALAAFWTARKKAVLAREIKARVERELAEADAADKADKAKSLLPLVSIGPGPIGSDTQTELHPCPKCKEEMEYEPKPCTTDGPNGIGIVQLSPAGWSCACGHREE